MQCTPSHEQGFGRDIHPERRSHDAPPPRLYRSSSASRSASVITLGVTDGDGDGVLVVDGVGDGVGDGLGSMHVSWLRGTSASGYGHVTPHCRMDKRSVRVATAGGSSPSSALRQRSRSLHDMASRTAAITTARSNKQRLLATTYVRDVIANSSAGMVPVKLFMLKARDLPTTPTHWDAGAQLRRQQQALTSDWLPR
jgi:hypothetical protein